MQYHYLIITVNKCSDTLNIIKFVVFKTIRAIAKINSKNYNMLLLKLLYTDKVSTMVSVYSSHTNF